MEVCFKETELCLGLPGVGSKGGGGGGTAAPAEGEVIVQKSTGKRAFMDLELNLKSEDGSVAVADLDETVDKSNPISSSAKDRNLVAKDPAKPPTKAQVVGWPPVRSYRKNLMAPQKAPEGEEAEKKGSGSMAFVKVSMDGAPYLRKVDLKTYGSYKELSDALGKMFSSFTTGNINKFLGSPSLASPEQLRLRSELRGQGRRLDARRGCPLGDVRGFMQAPAHHERIRSNRPRAESNGEVQEQVLINHSPPAAAECRSNCLLVLLLSDLSLEHGTYLKYVECKKKKHRRVVLSLYHMLFLVSRDLDPS